MDENEIREALKKDFQEFFKPSYSADYLEQQEKINKLLDEVEFEHLSKTIEANHCDKCPWG